MSSYTSRPNAVRIRAGFYSCIRRSAVERTVERGESGSASGPQGVPYIQYSASTVVSRQYLNAQSDGSRVKMWLTRGEILHAHSRAYYRDRTETYDNRIRTLGRAAGARRSKTKGEAPSLRLAYHRSTVFRIESARASSAKRR